MTTTNDSIQKDFLAPLQRRLEKEAIKYLVQKQMFCKATGEILDYRTCICVEVNDKNGRPIALSAVSPTQVDRLDNVTPGIHKFFPEATVIFKTLNNKLKHPLLTIIK